MFRRTHRYKTRYPSRIHLQQIGTGFIGRVFSFSDRKLAPKNATVSDTVHSVTLWFFNYIICATYLATILCRCREIWEPNFPGTLWVTPGLLRDCFTFFYMLCLQEVFRERIINGQVWPPRSPDLNPCSRFLLVWAVKRRYVTQNDVKKLRI